MQFLFSGTYHIKIDEAVMRFLSGALSADVFIAYFEFEAVNRTVSANIIPWMYSNNF